LLLPDVEYDEHVNLSVSRKEPACGGPKIGNGRGGVDLTGGPETSDVQMPAERNLLSAG